MSVSVCTHPVLQAKLSELRKKSSAKETRQLLSELSTILSVWVSSQTFTSKTSSTELTSAAGVKYNATEVTPATYALVPVLRSGLAMIDSFLTYLPSAEVPVYHLGLFREKISLQPVEYYNKLPTKEEPYDLAFVLDPIIATGGTAEAVVQALKEWGVKKVVLVSVLASKDGLSRLASEFGENELEIYVGAVDDSLSESGFILPGVGDLGDRLHSTHLD